MQPPKTSGLAIAGLILAFFCSIIGAIISVIALVQINGSNGQKTGKGLAIAGIILGIVMFILGIAIQASGGLKL